MDLEKIYNAKLMLVGEYGVVLGGFGLTIPLKNYHATLSHREHASDPERAIQSINHLRNLATYLRELPRNSFHAIPDADALTQMVTRGIYIQSTIPEGYGIGSSGVVSAIVYDQFFHDKEKLDLASLKKDLATIESYFHGKSSGVDALSCYIGKPVLFRSADDMAVIPFDPARVPGGYRFFLLDSGVVLETGPLVNKFLDRMVKADYREKINKEFLPLNRKLIEALTGERDADPAMLFRAVSDFQFKEFLPMIPESVRDPWLEGQVSNEYYLKLNGSGGGFILGICHENMVDRVNEIFTENPPTWID